MNTQIGIVLVIMGLLFLFGSHLHLPFGHLPGDWVFQGKHVRFAFPLMSCLIISIILSILFRLFGHK